MSFAIVTDSCANLPERLIERYHLYILSLMFRVGDKEYYSYIQGEVTDLAPFYDMMRKKEAVSTSQINPDVCSAMFRSVLDEGQDLLYIGFSSALSSTFQTAHMVLEELRAAYPQRKIYALDTLGASLGEGLLVWYAANRREQGESIEQVYQWLLENRLHLCHWFTVDDLFFLQRGGRVSSAAALFGTMLGVKPVLHMDNEGRLIPVAKVRGRKNSLDALIQRMEKLAIRPQEQTVFITHGDCIDDAQYVEREVRRRMRVRDVLINYVDPVIGAHSGPGTVALFFLGSER